jgi:endonuclease YncB( thermonuclease family)
VRFCGIDAPELAQPLGKESRDYLKQLVGSGSVRMIAVEKDKYGYIESSMGETNREIGWCG